MTCWDCGLRQAGGNTLLGFCRVFERIGKEMQEIPPTRVDVGCQYFEDKK